MSVKPIQLLPNLRTEAATATTGYTWGKVLVESNIIRILAQAGYQSEIESLGLAADDVIAERWVVSDDAELGSLAVDETDPTQTKSLRHLLDKDGELILGSRHFQEHGPYLGCIMKQLDTNTESTKGSLSVQVHPKPGHPTRPAKPEMWLGEGQLYLGWKHDVTAAEVTAAYEQSELEQLMNQIALTPSKLVLVAGGTIHAIRFNSFLYEWSMAPGKNDVMKGSLKDATVSPYDRTDGKTPRPGKGQLVASLQLLEESDGMRGTVESELITQPVTISQEAGASVERLFATREVFVFRATIAGTFQLDLVKVGRGLPIYLDRGEIVLSWGEEQLVIQAGQELLLPYSLQHCTIQSLGDSPAQLLWWYAPFQSEKEEVGLG